MLLTSERGGVVIRDGDLEAVYSGFTGKARAEAFNEAMTRGETSKMKRLARKSGISYKEIARALEIWESTHDFAGEESYA